MNEWVYYMKMKHGKSQQLRPSVTVVLIGENGGPYHRGMSICSVKDNPLTSKGRDKARGMARKAIHHKCDVEPIIRAEAKQVLESSWAPDNSMDGDRLAWEYSNWHKGAYDVELAPFEAKLKLYENIGQGDKVIITGAGAVPLIGVDSQSQMKK